MDTVKAVYDRVSWRIKASLRYFVIPKGFKIYHMKNKLQDKGAFGHSGFYFCHVDPRDYYDLMYYTFTKSVRFPRLYEFVEERRECRVAEFISDIGCELTHPPYRRAYHMERGVTQCFDGNCFAACSGAKCQDFYVGRQFGHENCKIIAEYIGGWIGCDASGQLEFFMYKNFAEAVLALVCDNHSLTTECSACEEKGL